MDDFAPGLPKKTDTGDLEKVRAGDLVDFIVQEHKAERAGRHYDVRLGTKKTGLFSWATKKELPKPGERIAVFQQPLHRHEYKDFEGEIPEGYGKGSVKKHEEGRLLVTKITPKSLHFTKADKRYPERFVLVRPKEKTDKRWLLINTTPTKPVDYKKLHYTKIDQKDAEKVLKNLQPGSSVQAKIDGAASLTKLMKDKAEVVSYRVSKKTGYPIAHTERLYGGAPVTVSIPKKYVGSVLRGELYGLKGKKAIPPQELGGLLNSSVEKSIKDQKKRKITLKNMVFDLHQLGEKTMEGVPYEERLEEAKKLLKLLPKGKFHPPVEAKTPEKAQELWEDVKGGKNPLSHEGIVIHQPHKKPSKVKLTDEHDVYITGFFPGEGKYKGKAVGGFTYSMKPGGPTVGKVGTGFSNKLRYELAKNPDEYVGRVAKVRAQEVLPSGALRAPALLSLHEDYPMKKLGSYLARVFI